jgi:hypothetical protein
MSEILTPEGTIWSERVKRAKLRLKGESSGSRSGVVSSKARFRKVEDGPSDKMAYDELQLVMNDPADKRAPIIGKEAREVATALEAASPPVDVDRG